MDKQNGKRNRKEYKMALLPIEKAGLGIKNPSNSVVAGGLQSDGNSYTTTKPAVVIGGVYYASTSGSSYASISSEGGGGYLFYPSSGKTGFGLRIVPSGTTITLHLASGAQGSVSIYDLDGFFTNV